MAQAWFRFYHEALDDPKIQQLDAETFKHWVNMLCLACRNDGFFPAEDAIAFALRIDNIACRSLLDRLANAGLIDKHKGGPNGSRIAPHGWAKRQYKSDVSTERVKRFRKRSETVSETADETPPDTETESDTENPPTPLKNRGSKSYAFQAKTIRVTKQDFDQWRSTYHAIPDLRAELTSLDAWLQNRSPAERKDWFHRVSGALNRKHQEFLRDAGGGAGPPIRESDQQRQERERREFLQRRYGSAAKVAHELQSETYSEEGR